MGAKDVRLCESFPCEALGYSQSQLQILNLYGVCVQLSRQTHDLILVRQQCLHGIDVIRELDGG
jgi:hypothetical protein